MGGGLELRVGHEVLLHLVLEDDAADGDAQGLAEGAEEAEHGDGEGEVLVRAGGLQLELQRGEEDAEAEAGDQVDEDPLRDGGVDVEEVQDPRAERRQCPAEPDGPAVAAGFGDQKADDDGAGRDGEGGGEESDAGDDGRVASHGFEIEGLVVQEAPEYEAVDDGVCVRDVCRPVREDGQTNDGFGRHELLV